MESLSVTELRHALDYLVKLATCPVCHETLTPEVALCVRGHPVCISCRQRLTKPECPLCRGAFSGVEPSGFIRQVIESLPHPCRHKGCGYFVKTEDNHEKFCTYKSTKCRYCDWSGAGQEIVAHLKSTHTSEADQYLSPFGSFEDGMPFNPKNQCSVFTPIYVDEHFFWGEMKNEPTSGKLTAIFHHVPNGKTKMVFEGSVKLIREGSYSAVIKLNMDPEVDPYVENCISIPTTILHKYTVDNRLKYRITVDITKLESLVSLFQSGIQSGIKSGVEFWKTANKAMEDYRL